MSWAAIATPAQNTGSRAELAIMPPAQAIGETLGTSACSGGLAKAWHLRQSADFSSGFCKLPGSVAALAGADSSAAKASETVGQARRENTVMAGILSRRAHSRKLEVAGNSP
ncbi:hypothetical protein OV079_35390 [Nannocystis pusilla]|uniref:Uncharacterized protein n=1 Tax=Nannocystis pusilla TaxID=889268 RepID=A0A9X3EUX1_9BACT|nr:hypothetical protein [Nannocystis pusilla]MCY1010759.1 hypothetical protein [Nannocystis pusilla]